MLVPYCLFGSTKLLSVSALPFSFSLQADLGSTDMALALNRYLCTTVLPLLTKCSALFCALEDHASLVDSLIQAIYSLSRALSLTKAQRDTIEDCLLAVCRYGFGWYDETSTRVIVLSPLGCYWQELLLTYVDRILIFRKLLMDNKCLRSVLCWYLPLTFSIFNL